MWKLENTDNSNFSVYTFKMYDIEFLSLTDGTHKRAHIVEL